jgi:small subunit ribosomal protein S14
MAKVSMVERQKKRELLVAKYAEKRSKLKEIAKDDSLPMEERFKARLKLAKLPRNSAPSRLHSRCLVTGRPRSYYRKLKMSRIALRDLASHGEIPGMVKSSW